jgi:hypothetical protein
LDSSLYLFSSVKSPFRPSQCSCVIVFNNKQNRWLLLKGYGGKVIGIRGLPSQVATAFCIAQECPTRPRHGPNGPRSAITLVLSTRAKPILATVGFRLKHSSVTYFGSYFGCRLPDRWNSNPLFRFHLVCNMSAIWLLFGCSLQAASHSAPCSAPRSAPDFVYIDACFCHRLIDQAMHSFRT